MCKFTPGPWIKSYGVFIQDSNGRLICEILSNNWKEDKNLIAAAPELYEALEKLRDRYVQVIGNEGIECYIARAALAKARGETND